MKISGAWMVTAGTERVFEAFRKGGFGLYFVGGCVRNSILGVPVSDIDMASEALPEDVISLAEAAGLKTVPTGLAHGTVTVVADHIAHEITTFRTDLSTDGRHAQIAYSKSLDEDAHRRDFTMNALYTRQDGQVIDPTGGLEDLAHRRVRFIDDPAQRITEDYLRILRFFRFHAWYGDPGAGLDADALDACARLSDGLDRLSRERIGAEMTKLLAAPDPAPSVAAMGQTGILSHVMPGADPRALGPLVYLEDGAAPDWRRRVLALGGDDVSENWRLSRSDARGLRQARQDLESMASISELAYRHGSDHATSVALARAAVFETPVPQDCAAQITTGVAAEFPVKAADLMPELSGAELGAALEALKTRWIQSGFRLTREELLT